MTARREPVEHSVLDAALRPVRVRDVVGGTTSGRYPATIVGPVLKLGAGRVKILVTSPGGGVRPDTGDEKWIASDRVFLVQARADDPACTCSPAPHGMTRPHTDDCPVLPAERDTRGATVTCSVTGAVDDFVRDVFGQPISVGDAVASWSTCDLLPLVGVVVALSRTSVTVIPLEGTDDGAGGEQDIPLGRVLLVPRRADGVPAF